MTGVSVLLASLVASLMAMAIVTIIAAIRLKKNWIVFILIPLLVFNVGFSWHTIDKLWGTPRHGFPDVEVEIIAMKVNKPWAYFLVKEPNEEHPTLYMKPWTKELEKKMTEGQRKMKAGKKVVGKEKKPEQRGMTQDPGEMLLYEWNYKQEMVPKNPPRLPPGADTDPLIRPLPGHGQPGPP